jgi:hypothetical protein
MQNSNAYRLGDSSAQNFIMHARRVCFAGFCWRLDVFGSAFFDVYPARRIALA